MSSDEQAKTSAERLKELVEQPWILFVLVLHVGLLGIPVYWKLKYSLTARCLIILGSIAYTVFAVVSIIWMLQWLGERLFG